MNAPCRRCSRLSRALQELADHHLSHHGMNDQQHFRLLYDVTALTDEDEPTDDETPAEETAG